MRVAGGLMLLGSAGCAVWLALQNRDVMIHARVGHLVWTGPLYMVLIFGALLAAWFLLGIAFLVSRRRPTRRHSSRSSSQSARQTPATVADERPPTVARQAPRPAARHTAAPPARQEHYAQPYSQPHVSAYPPTPTSGYRRGESINGQTRARAHSR